MPATKIQSNQSDQKAPKLPPLYVPAELHSLIGELMRPRAEMLLKIVTTRMVSEAQNTDEDEAGGDWWPDYGLYSQMHYMTEMNGLLHLAQNTLKGMAKDLQTIGTHFHAFVGNYLRERQAAGELISPGDRHQKFGRYLMAQSLIKDMVTFVNCCSRHTVKLLGQRSEYSERAAETKDTEDRIRLKIFDERSFAQLHSRMDTLKSFVQDFCDLFDSAGQATMPANGQNVSDQALAIKISS